MDILRTVRTILLLAVIIPVAAQAQSPRRVLLERFMNARTGQLMDQALLYDYTYLYRKDIEHFAIPITYHTNAPAGDPTYEGNPKVYDSRISYYSVTDVPSVYVNGRLPDPSSSGGGKNLYDTAAISQEIDLLRGTMSPLTITIDATYAPPTGSATIKVKSSEDISGKRLYVMLIDDFDPYPEPIDEMYGSYSTVQQIAPLEGHELTLAAGETKTFSAIIDIEHGSAYRDLYFVAFVQDSATKEVLQAADDLVSPIFDIVQDGSIRQPDDSPVEWTGTIGTTISTTYTVDMNIGLANGWTASLLIDEMEVRDGQHLELVAGKPKSFHLTITPSPTSLMRTGTVFFQIDPEHGNGESSFFTLHSGEITALLVPRNEPTRAIINAWENALVTSDTRYAFIGMGELPLFDLKNVVTVVEYGKNVMSELDTHELGWGLDNGMRLLISGAEVAYGLSDPTYTGPGTFNDTAFLHRNFHVEYVRDNANSATVHGVKGDPVAAGVEPLITTGYPNQDTPDLLRPRDGAIPIFHYRADGTDVAGIRYADAKNRLIYLGFGLEGIGDHQIRTDLMRRSIAWLMGSSSTLREAAATGTTLHAVHPNPAMGIVDIPFTLEHRAHMRLALHDLHGQRVATLADDTFDAGRSAVRFDTSTLPEGLYSIVMVADGVRSTGKMVVVR